MRPLTGQTSAFEGSGNVASPFTVEFYIALLLTQALSSMWLTCMAPSS